MWIHKHTHNQVKSRAKYAYVAQRGSDLNITTREGGFSIFAQLCGKLVPSPHAKKWFSAHVYALILMTFVFIQHRFLALLPFCKLVNHTLFSNENFVPFKMVQKIARQANFQKGKIIINWTTFVNEAHDNKHQP